MSDTYMLLGDECELSFAELCRACDVDAQYIITLVEEGLLDPHGASQTQWRFAAAALPRVQTVLRLQQEMAINLAGAAVILDLLEERRRLRERLHTLERLLDRI